jgi:hypothetical protein
MHNEHRDTTMLSTLFIASIGILLLNDLYLKSHWPGLITGKLSDVAGLFALPLFITHFFPRRKSAIYIATAIGFIAWKLPAAAGTISFINSILPYSIGRTVDFTDFWALLVLPLSYAYRPHRSPLGNGRGLRAVAGVIACFAFCATAGTHGRIKSYHYGVSKYKLQSCIDSVFARNPELKIPDCDTYYGGRSDPYFRCYIEDQRGAEVFTARYYGDEEMWKQSPDSSEIFIAYVGIYGVPMHIDADLTSDEKARVMAKFEKGFIAKLNTLSEPLPAEDGDWDDQ